MEQIQLVESVRSLLRSCLLDERDLMAGIRQERRVEVPGRPGHFRCACTVAVRRALDPETAELRRLKISLRQTETGLEVYDVEGLEPELEEL